jgi:hypothetical protein
MQTDDLSRTRASNVMVLGALPLILVLSPALWALVVAIATLMVKAFRIILFRQ